MISSNMNSKSRSQFGLYFLLNYDIKTRQWKNVTSNSNLNDPEFASCWSCTPCLSISKLCWSIKPQTFGDKSQNLFGVSELLEFHSRIMVLRLDWKLKVELVSGVKFQYIYTNIYWDHKRHICNQPASGNDSASMSKHQCHFYFLGSKARMWLHGLKLV